MKLKMQVVGLAICLGASGSILGLTGCAGNRYEQSTGEHIDDTATSMRVKKALGNDAEYKYGQVEVKTFKGTTQLSGFVNTQAQKKRAGDIAKMTEGVRDVQNNISVKE